MTVTSALALLVAGVLAGSVAVEHLQASRAPAGVITAMDVTVYKGPGSGYQRQFEQPLQPGVEFNVIEKRPGWWNIRLPDLKTGWIDSASGELVDTPPLRAKLAADSIDLARDGPEQSL